MFSAILLAAATVLQQASGTFVVTPNTPLKIQFEAVPAADNVYRWGCVSASTSNPSPAPVTLTVVAGAPTTGSRITYTADVPGLPAGVYGCGVGISNSVTTANNLPEVISDPIAVISGNLPVKAVNLSIAVR